METDYSIKRTGNLKKRFNYVTFAHEVVLGASQPSSAQPNFKNG